MAKVSVLDPKIWSDTVDDAKLKIATPLPNELRGRMASRATRKRPFYPVDHTTNK
jgi:hypothetical protein